MKKPRGLYIERSLDLTPGLRRAIFDEEVDTDWPVPNERRKTYPNTRQATSYFEWLLSLPDKQFFSHFEELDRNAWVQLLKKNNRRNKRKRRHTK